MFKPRPRQSTSGGGGTPPWGACSSRAGALADPLRHGWVTGGGHRLGRLFLGQCWVRNVCQWVCLETGHIFPPQVHTWPRLLPALCNVDFLCPFGPEGHQEFIITAWCQLDIFSFQTKSTLYFVQPCPRVSDPQLVTCSQRV